jgi:hypothetical protein
MIKETNNPDCYWDYTKGCWFCYSISDAINVMQKHPCETIMLFDRDKNGKTVNIRLYYEQGMDKPPSFKHVKHGQLIR